MQKQFRINKIDETYMVMDIVSGIEATPRFMRSEEFSAWQRLADQFVKRGASQAALEKAQDEVETNGTARLDI